MSCSSKISVIVPVYKAEKYLHRCVDSILAQTFTDFEVLLIDDGSPDRSGEICDEYAQKDSRVRVFHKENGGVSSARQCGIDNAQGEYTIHADPDDWVEPNMLEELYAKAKEDDADMVICDFYVNNVDRQIYKKQKPSALEHETVLRELFQQLHGSCCNKLVRRTCYSDYKVQFPKEFNLYEDLFVNTCFLINPIKVSYHPKAFYHYVISASDTSVTKKVDLKTVEENERFVASMLSVIKNPAVKGMFLNNSSYPIVLRGFKSRIFDNTEFVRRYKPYRKYIFGGNEGNIMAKLICYLSCLGLYGIFKHLY